jgi:hypothetical protein
VRGPLPHMVPDPQDPVKDHWSMVPALANLRVNMRPAGMSKLPKAFRHPHAGFTEHRGRQLWHGAPRRGPQRAPFRRIPEGYVPRVGALRSPRFMRQINAFMKSPSAIIGDGDTMVLPDMAATPQEGAALSANLKRPDGTESRTRRPCTGWPPVPFPSYSSTPNPALPDCAPVVRTVPNNLPVPQFGHLIVNPRRKASAVETCCV